MMVLMRSVKQDVEEVIDVLLASGTHPRAAVAEGPIVQAILSPVLGRFRRWLVAIRHLNVGICDGQLDGQGVRQTQNPAMISCLLCADDAAADALRKEPGTRQCDGLF
jgi:hypothetical protein